MKTTTKIAVSFIGGCVTLLLIANMPIGGNSVMTHDGVIPIPPSGFVSYGSSNQAVYYVTSDGVQHSFGSSGSTNIMVSTITYGTTLSPTFAISGLSTTAASCRDVTFRVTLTGNVTTISSPAGTLIDGDRMTIEFIQDATGTRTVTGWNAIFDFGGESITGINVNTNANRYSFARFQYNSSGPTWYVQGNVW